MQVHVYAQPFKRTCNPTRKTKAKECASTDYSRKTSKGPKKKKTQTNSVHQ